MSTYRILVSDNLSEKGLSILRSEPDIEVDVKTGLSPEELADTIGPYDALVIRSGTKVTAEVLARADNLKAIGRAGAGLDNVDREVATSRGIVVMNTPGGNTVSTAEHTWALMLALSRNVYPAARSLAEKRWDRKKYAGTEMFGKTLGTVGLGRVGGVVASRALAFGMKVLAFDPYVPESHLAKLGYQAATLEEVYAQSDYITLHAPATDETKGMINAEAIAKMKEGVRIVNCARGAIINAADLAAALDSGHVAGAAVDVYDKEPPDHEYPLFNRDNCLCTPHLAASTTEAQENVAIAVSKDVIRALHGEETVGAVNIPSISAETRAVLGPYVALAEKLGMFAIQLYGQSPEEVAVTYTGELSGCDTSLLNIAVLKGLLTPIMEDTVNYVNAPYLAEQRKIRTSEAKLKEGDGYSTMIELTLRGGGKELSLTGTQFGPDDPRIVKLDGYHIDAKPVGYILVFRNTDEPGIIGQIGTTLGNADINIADLTLGRKKAGTEAVSVCNIDQPASDEVLAEMKKSPKILDVNLVNLG